MLRLRPLKKKKKKKKGRKNFKKEVSFVLFLKKDLNGYFSKENIQMASEQIKDAQNHSSLGDANPNHSEQSLHTCKNGWSQTRDKS